jgi:hypothetical protein
MNILVTDDKQIVEIPDGSELIDDTFYVWETRFGLHSTMTKEGRKMLTSLEKDEAIKMTRWHLKCEQDGTMKDYTYIIGDAFVSGKL